MTAETAAEMMAAMAGAPPSEMTTTLSGTTRAAILLLTVGERLAAEVLKFLEPNEVQALGSAIARMKTVSRKDVVETLDSFLHDALERTALGIGTEEYLLNSLAEVVGTERARDLVNRILAGERLSGLDALRRMDPGVVARLLRNEHPQIAAIVLANLKPEHAAEVLALFPESQRPDLVTRIATMESLPPSAFTELDAIIDQKVSDTPNITSSRIGGLKTAVDMLNHLDQSTGVGILDSIREEDPDLGASLDEALFTFDDLVDISDRDIQMLLKEVPNDVMVKALRGGDERVKEKIFKNMSKRAAQLLRDDLEGAGPIRLADVEQAQKEVIGTARRMADSGEITLGAGEEYV